MQDTVNIIENVFSLNFVSVLTLSALQNEVADCFVFYDLCIIVSEE